MWQKQKSLVVMRLIHCIPGDENKIHRSQPKPTQTGGASISKGNTTCKYKHKKKRRQDGMQRKQGLMWHR
jgi:hypothetical protein